MDYEVIWAGSNRGPESIAGYISRDSISYAEAVVTKVLEATGTIKDFPFAGRLVPELGNEGIRE